MFNSVPMDNQLAIKVEVPHSGRQSPSWDKVMRRCRQLTSTAKKAGAGWNESGLFTGYYIGRKKFLGVTTACCRPPSAVFKWSQGCRRRVAYCTVSVSGNCCATWPDVAVTVSM